MWSLVPRNTGIRALKNKDWKTLPLPERTWLKFTSSSFISHVAFYLLLVLPYSSNGFNPWVGKILWRREWQSTPVFLSGELHGQKSLVSYSPWGRRVGHDWVTHTHTSVSAQGSSTALSLHSGPSSCLKTPQFPVLPQIPSPTNFLFLQLIISAGVWWKEIWLL